MGSSGLFWRAAVRSGLGLVELVLADEDMGEGSGGGGVLRVGGEYAAVGCFGGGKVVAGFGQFAGEEDVVGGFGRDFESGQKFVAGVGGARVLVDAGEGAVGTGLDGGVVGGEGGGLVEFGAGVGQLAAAGEEEAEGYVRFEEVGIGGDGSAVGGFGGGGLVEGVLGEAEIVEEVGVVGGFFSQRGEEFQRGGVVLTVDGGVGFGALGILRVWFGAARWCRWCLLGVGRGRSYLPRELSKILRFGGRKGGDGVEEPDRFRGVVSSSFANTPMPYLSVQSIQKEGPRSVLRSAVKYGSPAR